MMPVTCTILTSVALAAGGPGLPQSDSQALSFGRFGPLTLYNPAGPPTSVVLFASGDGGWTLGVVGMAKRLRDRGALVVGFDIRHYLRAVSASTSCVYAAAGFEALGQYVERSLDLARYLPPVLIGYSSGATLVYVALAQAPPNAFKGAISLGFCSDLPGQMHWCPGTGALHATPLPRNGGWDFAAVERLPAPWIVLHGSEDQVCPVTAAAEFVSHIELAELVQLPKVGHGFGVEARWLGAFDAAFQRIVTAPERDPAPPPGPIADLPLVEVPVPDSLPAGDLFAIMLSGDGGWAGIDREVSQRLAQRGIPVVGLNSLRYFWKAKSPETLGVDLTRMLEHYAGAWHRGRVLLLGYSLGADVLPFAIAELPALTRSRVAGVGLIGLSRTASFEFRVANWVGRPGAEERPTWPALEVLPGLIGDAKVACLFGADETDSGCRASPGIDLIRMPGGHHLGGDFDGLTDRLLSALAARR